MEAILLSQIYFFLNMIRVIEEAILRNCLNDEVDLTSESMCSEIGLLTVTSVIIYHNAFFQLHDFE